jgi:L-asparagine oxygenase
MLPPFQVAEQLASHGFALAPRFMPGVSSPVAFAAIGVVDVVEGLSSVRALKPQCTDESLPNTYSGNFGIEEFPLQTDLAHWGTPPRFLALRCVRDAASTQDFWSIAA